MWAYITLVRDVVIEFISQLQFLTLTDQNIAQKVRKKIPERDNKDLTQTFWMFTFHTVIQNNNKWCKQQINLLVPAESE